MNELSAIALLFYLGCELYILRARRSSSTAPRAVTYAGQLVGPIPGRR